MLDEIESAIKDLISSLQIAKLYGTSHLEFQKSLDKAYNSLQDILKMRDSLVIGLVAEELAFEKEILFDLTKVAGSLIGYLKAIGIEKMGFYRGLQKDELQKFVTIFTVSKDEIKGSSQDYLLKLGVKNIAVGKITLPSQEVLKNDSAKPVAQSQSYEVTLENLSQSLDTLLISREMDLLSLKFTVNNVMENLAGRYQELLKLSTIKKFDTTIFVHLLNVSILSMYFSSKLGFDKEDVLDIGTAGLFHDIGKLYISRKILKKPGELTKDEFDKVKNHSELGAELLLKYVDSLGILPVVVAFEHHIRYDLKGYPKLTLPQRPHNASFIVSICDVYDAILQRRSYKRDYPPNMIYDFMIKEKERVFEPNLLERFFKIIGVWPIGTIVYLTDQRIAVVREQNPDDIFSPKVETIFPQDRRELVDLKEKKPDLKIEYALNPFGEGKNYLDFI